MFNGHKIIGNTLYLYVDYSCEIGSIFNKEKQESLVDKVLRYIKDRKINFVGTKVILVLSGLMLGSIYLGTQKDLDTYKTNRETKYVYNVVDTSVPELEEVSQINKESDNKTKVKEEKEDIINRNVSTKMINNNVSKTTNINNSYNESAASNTSTSNATDYENMVTVKRTNGTVINISMDNYLIGVVGAEMPASFNNEALKAQSVIARTYTYKLLESGRTLTDSVSTQVYKDNNELKAMWGSDYNKYYDKIKNAVLSTEDEVVTYNGSLIDAVYHSTSNGYTEDSINVWGNSYPYLKTVSSPWDTSASSFSRTVEIPYSNISSVLNIPIDNNTAISITSRNDSGRVSKISIGDKEYTGVEIRNLLGLRSADFDIDLKENTVVFTNRGYGHGVGMSQYGANGMANAGYDYKQILKYYYMGVQITRK